MTYHECEACGAALDPGEHCDCTTEITSLPAIRCTQLPVISENLGSVRQNLEILLADISTLPQNDEALKYVKQIRANLSKDFARLEDQRKAVKRQVMEPYEQAEVKYKEFIATPYKEADDHLHKWISHYQDGLKQNCTAFLREYFNELCRAQGIDFLPFQHCNIVVDMTMARQKEPKKAMDQITSCVMGVRADMDTILKMDDAEEVMAEYRRCPVLSSAVTTVANRKRERERMTAYLAEQRQQKEEKSAEQTALLAAAPEILPEQEERYTVAFMATGSIASLKAMKAYGLTLGITFEEIDQEEENDE